MAAKMSTPLEGRGRKRKRQVSWAAAELLEEVKLFHMAKPVNPSIPPPVVDDGGEDADGQPGLALLGLLGIESSSSLPASTPFSTASPSPSSITSSSTTFHAPVGGAGMPSGGDNSQPSATSAQLPSEVQGGSCVGSSSHNGDGPGGAEGGPPTGRTVGASRLFKGFEKTETVVRRKKLAPPPPPAGPPPPIPPPGEGEHLTHRYPKDIWPGHKPPNHTVGGEGANDGESAGRAGDEEQLEFFCDGCDETIPSGVERMECAVCPDEFCLCHGCYDEGEVLDKRHKHELLPSAAPFHVTRAAPSAAAALEAAKALHVAEAQHGEGLAYDEADLG